MTDQNQPPVPPPGSSAPQYQAAPPPPSSGPAQPGATFPGKSLGIAGLIVSIAGFFIFQIIAPIAGLIMSVIARKQSKQAGYENGPAKAGIIVSIIALVLGVIGLIIVIALLVATTGALVEACQGLGPGVHEVDGITYTCS